MSWAVDAERALSGAVAAIDRDTTVITPDDRRFEIGSVTKTMTATVLAQLVGAGVLRLDDEIGRWLSAGANGTITVRQLATHTSGLPSTPPGLSGGRNPWVGYTFAAAEADLRRSTPGPGHRRYSNLGYQLLGLILVRATGSDYPSLLTERLLVPLGMTGSSVGGEYPLGAGGVTATIGDLARYARACLFPPSNALGAAITLAQQPVVDMGDGVRQALGWVVRPGGVCEHSGGTHGFSACVTVDHDRGRAVAILSDVPGGPARSDQLKRAARLVLAGEHPERPPVPWPDWRDDVLAVARDLVDGYADRVHSRLVAERRATITPERLAAAVAKRTGNAGEITLAHHEVSATGTVVAEVLIGPVRLRIAVLPTGELGGLAFPPG
ncbi:MAG TPA: serine hydrolase domain-containing protein [Pseudonocardiaceae bacterium]|nr:serine hydrolase domain-containing protein [Pseudonocardiaceae bacterium]